MRDSRVGRTIQGRYRLYDRVGEGGFASVYLARDLETNEVVAVKLLHPQFAADPANLRRFQREAALLQRLHHPNIVRLLASGEEDDLVYIVMEYVQGLTLADVIARRGRLAISEAIAVGLQTLDALEAALTLDVIHRDIKPHNLMLTAAGDLKVMDFGLARETTMSSLTEQGTLVGTLRYLAPELVQGDDADTRADLYAVGVTLYECFAGRPPFGASSPGALLNQLINSAPPPLEGIRTDLPPALIAVVARALAKDPADRFQTTTEMRSALEVFHDMPSLPTISNSETRPTPPPPITEAPIAAPPAVTAAMPQLPAPSAAAAAAPTTMTPEVHTIPPGGPAATTVATPMPSTPTDTREVPPDSAAIPGQSPLPSLPETAPVPISTPIVSQVTAPVPIDVPVAFPVTAPVPVGVPISSPRSAPRGRSPLLLFGLGAVALAIVAGGLLVARAPAPSLVVEPPAPPSALSPAASEVPGDAVRRTGTWETFPSSGLSSPAGIALDSAGFVYVADSGNNRIQRLGSNGRVAARAVEARAPDLKEPLGMAAEPTALIIADAGNNQIARVPAQGQPSTWGSAGSGPGQFQHPSDVALDTQGNIYVADTLNHRIQKLSATGQTVAQWGAKGSGPGQFDMPSGIAVDGNGDIYVADTGNHRIQKLSPTGQPLAQWGRRGNGLVQFLSPRDVVVDAQGNLYVADTDNARIQLLSPRGEALGVWRNDSNGRTVLRAPVALALDGHGAIIIADTSANRVVRLTPNP